MQGHFFLGIIIVHKIFAFKSDSLVSMNTDTNKGACLLAMASKNRNISQWCMYIDWHSYEKRCLFRPSQLKQELLAFEISKDILLC